MSTTRYGFVGLGSMGAPMAGHLATKGLDLTVYDKAGTEDRAPAGASHAASLEALAACTDVVFLSVPDGGDSLEIAQTLAALKERAAQVVVDLSTIGIEAARQIGGLLASAGMTYVDSPVSGGRSGAVAGTITFIWAGPAALMDEHRSALDAMAGNVFHVGDEPGQGQAAKLLNNYLSATSMAATSEAMAFGLSQGLDLETMLNVVNVSSGRNTATSDKFVNRILTGSYDAGFRTDLMCKDVSLYLKSAEAANVGSGIARSVNALWQDVQEHKPGSDITRVFDHVREGETKKA